MSEGNIIKLLYEPRNFWGGESGIHKQLDVHRFCVIVAHRRFGKTVGVINHQIKDAIINESGDGRFAYIAPYRNQAKAITWDYFKRYTANIPGVKFNESDLFIEFPNGSRLRLFGADNAEAIRGLYFDGIVIDEVADIKPEVWGEIIRPTLSDRNGKCVFIGTPKGQNLFFEMYQRALNNDDWYSIVLRADETGVLPQVELDSVKREVSDNQYRQEFLCDFSAAVDDVLISLDTVVEAERRNYKENDYSHAPVVFGIDVARFGDDSSVICIRQGLVMKPLIRFKKADNVYVAGQIAELMNKEKPTAVFIDSTGGHGSGVIDILRSFGHQNIIGVHFGEKPSDNHYYNKRSEIWGKMGKWLTSGQIPEDHKLRQELTIPKYSYDSGSRMRLEQKDEIKKRVGWSPDGADALALTFSYQVGNEKLYESRNAKISYDPFERIDKRENMAITDYNDWRLT